MSELFFKSSNILHRLEIDEVCFFTKRNKKVLAIIKDQLYEIDTSLYYINEILSKNVNFIRCHKSFIVNLKKIKEIVKYNNKTYNIYFKDTEEVAFITQKNLKILSNKALIL